MSIPAELLYSSSHEWVRVEDGVATVGISHHAQDQLGEVVFVDLPEVDDDVTAGETCAEIESTKAVSDIYSPVSGVVVAINEDLEDEPERVNQAPYAAGWLFKVKLAEVPEMMDAAAYEASLA